MLVTNQLPLFSFPELNLNFSNAELKIFPHIRSILTNNKQRTYMSHTINNRINLFLYFLYSDAHTDIY